MGSIDELFERAQHHHQRGDLRQAETLYRQVLGADPAHAFAHHYLGLLAHQTGHADAALSLMRQAIAINPGVAVFYSNLGVVLQAAGQSQEALDAFTHALRLNPDLEDAHNNRGNLLREQGNEAEAVQCYRQVLRLNPNHATSHYNLANVLKDQGQWDAAIASYRQALRLNPRHVDAHNNLGVALKKANQLAEAIECFREGLRLDPHCASAHLNLGNVYKDRNQLTEAVECYRQALQLKPDDVDANYNLGIVRKEQGQLADAVACYRQALHGNPQFVDALSNLGLARKEQGHLAEAIDYYRQALRINPDHVSAHINLSDALSDLGQYDEAAACLEHALRLQPNDPVALYNRSLLRLLTGDFARGWPDYEHRWKDPSVAIRSFDQPRWDGSTLKGKTILIYAEQGLGDTIQFIRYAKRVKQRGGTVLFESEPQLLQLLASVAGIARLVPKRQPLPPFDVQIPQLSLPGLFGTTLGTIPADVPYLFAHVARVEHWRKKLESLRGLKVGISWQGNPSHRGDRQRSVPLTLFEPLAQLSGVRLVSLQKGAGSEQIAAQQGRIPLFDAGTQLGDMADTAALMTALDLIISVDTSVVHLAGALGRPTWVLLPFAPDWRWLLDREDSPWYPTLRLFRQSEPGGWADVFARVACEICEEIQARAGDELL